MICACGCAQDEHDEHGTGVCELSRSDKRHLCGGFEEGDEE